MRRIEAGTTAMDMAGKQRIGIRDVREFREGETIWNGAVSGFCDLF
jgi:hypothetical protein